MKQTKTEANANLQSKVIDLLRFPLIIGVLFIHNAEPTVNIQGMMFGNSDNLLVYDICSSLFSQVLGRVSVPLFFFISGFLFFLNVDKFDRQSYLKKLKCRAKTLLVPYLFWNIFCLVLLYFIFLVPALNSFVNHKPELNLTYILKSLWVHEDSYPVSYQFWFIRDLMIIIVLTPILYLYTKKTSLFGVVLLGVAWFFRWWFRVPGFSIDAIFFFTAGVWFSINKRNLIEDASKIKRLSFVLYPIIVLVDLLTKQYEGNVFVHHTGIIVGIVFGFNLSTVLLNAGKVRINKFLVTSSFFVFAFHEPCLRVIRKLTFVFLNPDNDLLLTAFYFINVLTVAFIALILYYLLKRFLPKFTQIITGGRL